MTYRRPMFPDHGESEDSLISETDTTAPLDETLISESPSPAQPQTDNVVTFPGRDRPVMTPDELVTAFNHLEPNIALAAVRIAEACVAACVARAILWASTGAMDVRSGSYSTVSQGFWI
jgi:hypothetical protein